MELQVDGNNSQLLHCAGDDGIEASWLLPGEVPWVQQLATDEFLAPSAVQLSAGQNLRLSQQHLPDQPHTSFTEPGSIERVGSSISADGQFGLEAFVGHHGDQAEAVEQLFGQLTGQHSAEGQPFTIQTGNALNALPEEQGLLPMDQRAGTCALATEPGRDCTANHVATPAAQQIAQPEIAELLYAPQASVVMQQPPTHHIVVSAPGAASNKQAPSTRLSPASFVLVIVCVVIAHYCVGPQVSQAVQGRCHRVAVRAVQYLTRLSRSYSVVPLLPSPPPASQSSWTWLFWVLPAALAASLLMAVQQRESWRSSVQGVTIIGGALNHPVAADAFALRPKVGSSATHSFCCLRL